MQRLGTRGCFSGPLGGSPERVATSRAGGPTQSPKAHVPALGALLLPMQRSSAAAPPGHHLSRSLRRSPACSGDCLCSSGRLASRDCLGDKGVVRCRGRRTIAMPRSGSSGPARPGDRVRPAGVVRPSVVRRLRSRDCDRLLGVDDVAARGEKRSPRRRDRFRRQAAVHPRTKGCHSGAGATGATSPRRYLCRSVIVLATARALHPARSAFRAGSAGDRFFTIGRPMPAPPTLVRQRSG